MTDLAGAPKKKSGRGCLIVLSVLGGLFFLDLVGVGVAVGKDMQSLFDSDVSKPENLPAKLSVYCQPGPFDTPPTCADVARTFVKAAPPSERFLATVKRQADSKLLCSSLYSKTGEFVADVTAKPKSK
jgi:hypothetical protein